MNFYKLFFYDQNKNKREGLYGEEEREDFENPNFHKENDRMIQRKMSSAHVNPSVLLMFFISSLSEKTDS